MKKNKYDDDDGRKIADMSFTYDSKDRPKDKKKRNIENQGENLDHVSAYTQPLTKQETRFMMFRAVGASLLIALVFITLAALFILFCIYVWFR